MTHIQFYQNFNAKIIQMKNYVNLLYVKTLDKLY